MSLALLLGTYHWPDSQALSKPDLVTQIRDSPYGLSLDDDQDCQMCLAKGPSVSAARLDADLMGRKHCRFHRRPDWSLHVIQRTDAVEMLDPICNYRKKPFRGIIRTIQKELDVFI